MGRFRGCRGIFLVFWLAQGRVPASGSGFAFTWLAFCFPVAGAAFSGISIFDLLHWLFLRPSAPLLSNLVVPMYLLGTLGLVLMGWVWIRLRNTRYRPMVTCLLLIIVLYATAFVAMYVRSASVSFEERHLRYSGILFFLLGWLPLISGVRLWLRLLQFWSSEHLQLMVWSPMRMLHGNSRGVAIMIR